MSRNMDADNAINRRQVCAWMALFGSLLEIRDQSFRNTRYYLMHNVRKRLLDYVIANTESPDQHVYQ